MSDTFFLRRRKDHNVDQPTCRRVPVDAHVGTPEDFRARLARAAREAALGLHRAEYFQRLFLWATDERLLHCAWEHLRRHGGQAPGVDGVTYRDVPPVFVMPMLRDLRDELREGRFIPDQLLPIEKPKLGGTGTRKLELPVARERTIGRSMLEGIQPYFELQFDERSMGFRPRRDRYLAFAVAERLAIDEDRWLWVPADICNAFPSVPRQRLLDIVRNQIPNTCVVELIDKLSGYRRKRGIPQGQPLCPFLLNLYLDRFLDRVWRRRHPDIPLIRAADDLLLLCRSEEEARTAIQSLVRILRDAGLKLKGDPYHMVRDVRFHPVEWLGAELKLEGGHLQAGLTQKARQSLEAKLEEAHRTRSPPITAIDCIQGWINQHGLALTNQRVLQATLGWLRETAKAQSFEEVPRDDELAESARRGAHRFQQLQQIVAEHPQLAGPASRIAGHSNRGAAPQRDRSADDDQTAQFAPAPRHGEPIVVYTDGAALGPRGPGGWAYLIRRSPAREQIADCAGVPVTTNNRMELQAAIEALSHIRSGERVRIITDSSYVAGGINGRLQRWFDDGTLFSSHPLTVDLLNRDLWQQLFGHLNRVCCTAELIRSHRGVVENEICDELARNAALEALWPQATDFENSELAQ